MFIANAHCLTHIKKQRQKKTAKDSNNNAEESDDEDASDDDESDDEDVRQRQQRRQRENLSVDRNTSETHESGLTPAQEALEEAIRITRSRIEHYFAQIDRHLCMTYNRHKESFMDAQFNFLNHVEATDMDVRHDCLKKDYRYSERITVNYQRRDEWLCKLRAAPCTCDWKKDGRLVNEREITNVKATLATKLLDNKPDCGWPVRRSAKDAKRLPREKLQKSKAEVKNAFVAAKDEVLKKRNEAANKIAYEHRAVKKNERERKKQAEKEKKATKKIQRKKEVLEQKAAAKLKKAAAKEEKKMQIAKSAIETKFQRFVDAAAVAHNNGTNKNNKKQNQSNNNNNNNNYQRR
jgi:hypothetical protein